MIKNSSLSFLSGCVLIGIAILSSCCNNHYEANFAKDPIRTASPDKLYRRDSAFIARTIWEFMDKEVYIYDFYKKYNIPFSKITVDIDTILYSPDTLKMFAFVIKKVPDPESKVPDDYYYNGNNVEGFRSSTNEPWIIYPTYFCAVSSMPNYNMVRQTLRNYFFIKFKSASHYIWDSSKQDLILTDYKYNLDEKTFWDSSIVWKKGALTSGAYIFQNKGVVKPDDSDPVWIIPKLNYPDSLLRMYK